MWVCLMILSTSTRLTIVKKAILFKCLNYLQQEGAQITVILHLVPSQLPYKYCDGGSWRLHRQGHDQMGPRWRQTTLNQFKEILSTQDHLITVWEENISVVWI